jgi:FkbM family methyltransferase
MDLDRIAETYRNPPVRGRADLRQDVLALAVHDFRTHGYFVEFGAMDGVQYSNTWLLETQYHWTGVVAEPARCWHTALQANRQCRQDFRAVTGRTGQHLEFKETQVQLGLSGLVDFFDPHEMHTRRRRASAGDTYQVESVSLTDLLLQHDAPRQIDYISMDTEGSESDILDGFDFDQWQVGLWTIEHNRVPHARDRIHDIMTRHGYQRILPELSTIDDWYVPAA